MPKIELKSLKNKAEEEIEKTRDLKELQRIFENYLGKKGEVFLILRTLKEMFKMVFSLEYLV